MKAGFDMGQGTGKVPGLFVHSFFRDFPRQESLFKGFFRGVGEETYHVEFSKSRFSGIQMSLKKSTPTVVFLVGRLR